MAGGVNGPLTLNGAEFTYPVKTLAQIRTDIVKRLGFAAMLATPPPGLNLLLDSLIQTAYEELYFRYHMLRTLRWWQIDVVQGSRFYDVPYEGAYSGALTDLTLTPGTPDTLDRAAGSWITDGFVTGQQIRLVDSNASDGVYTVGASVAALSMELTSNSGIAAQAAGNQMTVSEVGFVNMEFRKLSEAWVLDGTTWSALKDGIPSHLFNQTSQYIPSFFELRERVEIWPEPDKAYELYFQAHLGMTPLTADTDRPAIDDKPVFLMALADAKAHYGQPDARVYYRQLEVHIGKLNAGTFGTKRYIHGEEPQTPLPYPKVTFNRP